MSAATLVDIAQIAAARSRIADVLRPTPCVPSDSLSRIVGRPVILKPEHLQRTGSFKIRGAASFISRLDPGGLVTAGSAGNHAQGVALAASLTGRASRIYMPASAALPKLAATRAYGAEVVIVDGGVDVCIARATEDAARSGATLVPTFDHSDVIAGQGTIGIEIAEEAPEAEVVVVAVGGGGLVAGIGAALASLRPGVRVVGVQAEGADSMRRSLASGRRERIERPTTMADGVALGAPGELTLAHATRFVSEVVTVTEEEISRAMLLLLERAKAVVEPSGALPVAALLAGKVAGSGPAVAVLSGGNVDPLLLTRLIEHGMGAAGRYLLVRVVIDDRPGGLHRLTGALAELKLNVLSVEHVRTGLSLPLGATAVLVSLETHGPDHRAGVVADLRTRGYDVELMS